MTGGRLAAAVLGSALLAMSAAPSRADLPADAQAAVKDGLIAAQQQQWEIALEKFEAAHKAAPDDPEIVGDLGLTESKIPGRELRAIAWFGAYLAAEPHAANAAAVRDAIDTLRIRNEGNVRRLIQLAQDAAVAVPMEAGWSPDDYNRNRAFDFGTVATLWAASGDPRAAQSAIARIPKEGDRSLAEVGVYQTVIRQVASGELAEAQAAAEKIPYLPNKVGALAAVADAKAKAGDIAGARASILVAQAAVDQITEDAPDKITGETSIAYAQAEAGDLSAAQASIRTAQALADSLAGPQFGLPLDELKSMAASDIATARAMVNAVIAARAASADTKAQPLPASPWPTLSPDVGLGDPNPGVAVSDWTGKLDGDLNTPLFLDPAGFLGALPADVAKRSYVPSIVPQNTFQALADAAKAAVSASNLIDIMLKRQARQQAAP
jgi:hypothetical protein